MVVEETGAESKLKMESLSFTELHFTRTEDDIDDKSLKLSMDRYIEKLDDNKYCITLSVGLTDEKREVNIRLTSKGTFVLQDPNELMPEIRDKVISNNTVAIMFPYIRSQLSLLTTQPNLTPVILPSMNINALLEKQ